MTFITEQQLRDRYELARRQSNTRFFSATQILNENRISDSSTMYDIFLSHSSEDDQKIAGLKLLLEDNGFTVYVDWNDPELDPDNVTPKTAAVLRERMSHCKSLVYAYSEHARESKWMPWELGYFDGLKNSMVAVLPIAADDNSKSIEGSEYVGLYYIIDVISSGSFWVNYNSKFVSLKDWLSGKQL